MNEKSNDTSFEEALMHELRFGGMDQDNLKELVGIAAKIQQEGMSGCRAFTKGLPSLVDGLRISGVVNASEFSRFLGAIVTKTPRLGGIYAFPYGLPWPDVFMVNIDIGTVVESRSLT